MAGRERDGVLSDGRVQDEQAAGDWLREAPLQLHAGRDSRAVPVRERDSWGQRYGYLSVCLSLALSLSLSCARSLCLTLSDSLSLSRVGLFTRVPGTSASASVLVCATDGFALTLRGLTLTSGPTNIMVTRDAPECRAHGFYHAQQPVSAMLLCVCARARARARVCVRPSVSLRLYVSLCLPLTLSARVLP